MVSAPRDMAEIITSLIAQYLSAQAVKLMPDGLLLGWCQLQESFTSFPDRGRRLTSPFASIPNGKGCFAKVGANFFGKLQKIFPIRHKPNGEWQKPKL